MALQCLYNYTGDTIVHVGELFGQNLCLPGAWYALGCITRSLLSATAYTLPTYGTYLLYNCDCVCL